MIKALIITLALCGAGMAQAGGVAACNKVVSDEEINRNTHDHGNGMVSYVMVRGNYSTRDEMLMIESCESGARLRVTMKHEDNFVKTAEYDVAAKATHTFERALHVGRSIDFRELQGNFKRLGADTERYVSTHESCACARAYPGMRGSKVKYAG